jgi:hypothetical protein
MQPQELLAGSSRCTGWQLTRDITAEATSKWLDSDRSRGPPHCLTSAPPGASLPPVRSTVAKSFITSERKLRAASFAIVLS